MSLNTSVPESIEPTAFSSEVTAETTLLNLEEQHELDNYIILYMQNNSYTRKYIMYMRNEPGS